jgi:hypothetical protein
MLQNEFLNYVRAGGCVEFSGGATADPEIWFDYANETPNA